MYLSQKKKEVKELRNINNIFRASFHKSSSSIVIANHIYIIVKCYS
jgi:hypothetical protein